MVREENSDRALYKRMTFRRAAVFAFLGAVLALAMAALVPSISWAAAWTAVGWVFAAISQVLASL